MAGVPGRHLAGRDEDPGTDDGPDPQQGQSDRPENATQPALLRSKGREVITPKSLLPPHGDFSGKERIGSMPEKG
jgi:hypothetical protein